MSSPPVVRPARVSRGRFVRSADRGIVGGVAAGLARYFGLPPTVVRVALVCLTVAGGLGVIVYVGLWFGASAAAAPDAAPADPGERSRGLALLAVGLLAGVLGLAVALGGGGGMLGVVVPVVVVAVGAALLWREFDRDAFAASRGPLAWVRLSAGATLIVAGLAVVVLGQEDLGATRSTLFAVVATLVGVGLLSAPVWVRLWRTAESERAARIREAERSAIAAHLHDSVLQTLALIQRRAEDPAQVATLARRQERELRQWLFADAESGGPTTLGAAIDRMADDVEETFGLRVDHVVVGGDTAVDPAIAALLGATREALVNVAKHAGVERADVYVEAAGGEISVFVRDRGCGFDPASVPDDRQGLARSVVARVEGVGGSVRVRSSAGAGAEVAMTVPRAGSGGTGRADGSGRADGAGSGGSTDEEKRDG